MFRISFLLIPALLVFVGCGSPASDTTAPAEEAPAAGSESKPAGSDSEPAGSASKSETTVTPVVFNADGAPVVEFEAPGMHCEFCAATIVEAVKDKPGVVDVKADAETKVVTIAVEEGEFEADAITAAIADAGFAEAPESESPTAENAG